jgi:peptidyl-prolyl cis-trans isomerase C
MTLTRLPLLLTAACLLYACDNATQRAATPAEGSDEEIVATVNDEPITARELDAYLAERQAAQPEAPPDRQTALDELVKLEVVKQEAETAGVAARPDVQAALDWQRTNLLVNTFMRERMSDMAFSEDEIRAEYEAQVARLSDREYKARHILTKTRAQAEKIIGRLNEGADFVKLSEEVAADPTVLEASDLGWFGPDAMVPAFAQAVQNLKPGTYTKKPIKTQFGWHVILLEDSRKREPPAYAEVKERLRTILTSKALESYIDKLRQDAEVEIKAGAKQSVEAQTQG